MKVKQILDEIAAESSTNAKMEILAKYKDNDLLKRVIYLAKSKRIKYYIKQIPGYTPAAISSISLEEALVKLEQIYNRNITGHAALAFLSDLMSNLPVDDSYIIERIIDRDMKIGMGTTLINNIWPKLIEKTGYMGCKPYSKELVTKILVKKKAFSQTKMDGMFVNIIIRGGEVEMESRQGEAILLDNPKFLTELRQLKDCVLNAEFTIDGVDRYQSNGIMSSLVSIHGKTLQGKNVTKEIAKFESKHMPQRQALDLIRVTAWDILTVDEYYDRESKKVYHERLKELEETLYGYTMLSLVENKVVTTIEEAFTHFEDQLKINGEGTVLKSCDGLWKDGKPNYQVKLKKEIHLDLKIVGFNYGTNKNAQLISSIDVETSDGILKTSPTGITEDDMRFITDNQDKLLGDIVEVKCSGISQDSLKQYSLMHPVFIRLRTGEKTEANSLEECIEINNSASLL